jgi:hypothetical protein
MLFVLKPDPETRAGRHLEQPDRNLGDVTQQRNANTKYQVGASGAPTVRPM